MKKLYKVLVSTVFIITFGCAPYSSHSPNPSSNSPSPPIKEKPIMNIFIADGVNLKECCQTIVITILEVNSFESLYNYDDSMYYGSKRSSDETEDLIKNIFSNQLEDILLMNGYTVLDRNMMHDIMHEQGLSETGLSVSNQIKINLSWSSKNFIIFS